LRPRTPNRSLAPLKSVGRLSAIRPYNSAVATAAHTTADPSGLWTLTQSRPANLAGLVESIWYFEGFIPHPRERHFPSDLAGLVVQLEPPFHFIKDGTRERCPTTCLSGMQTGPTVIEAPAPMSRVLGVRLTPAGAYMVAGGALSETSGRVVDLADLVGRAASELAERCDQARSAEARLRRAAAWLSEHTLRARALDPRIAWAAARIEATHGSVAIAHLQDQTGLSRKRFVAAFREQIGVAPKIYARIMRFRRALRLLHEGGASLSRIALDAGYYGQPHMNLEFRELGGLAPGEFLAASRYSPTTADD
jgi:AraC-like DNA-binding protein